MKVIKTMLLVFILFSCSEEENEIMPTTVSSVKNEIRLTVMDCSDQTCDDFAGLSDIEISFHSTREDAEQDINTIYKRTTDLEGRVSLNNIEQDIVFIRIDFTSGVYIAQELVFQNSISHHNVRVIEGFNYSYNDRLQLSPSMSFINPLVGQERSYRYFYEEDPTSLAEPISYESNILTIKIVEILGPDVFLIEEIFNEVPAELSDRYNEKSNSKLSLRNGSTFIEAYDTEYITSPILGLYDSTRLKVFELPQQVSSSHEQIEMTTFDSSSFSSFIYGENISLGNNIFSYLLGTWVCLANSGGEDIINMYSVDEGFIRSVQIKEGEYRRGFDLM